jgi:hypothetical protein
MNIDDSLSTTAQRYGYIQATVDIMNVLQKQNLLNVDTINEINRLKDDFLKTIRIEQNA